MIGPTTAPLANAPSASFGGMNAAKLLAALTAVVIAVALLTPEAPGRSEGGSSSYSTAPGGLGMMFELAQRTGWHAVRRITPMDSTVTDTTVQVVIEPQIDLGAHEVHRLLENVRRGGGLIFAIDGADELDDSLGVGRGLPGRYLAGYADTSCPQAQTFRSRALLVLPPQLHGLTWRRKAPVVVPLVKTDRRFGPEVPVAVGVPLGRGRVAIAGTPSIFTNDAVGVCEWGADVAVAQLLEYVRPAGVSKPTIVFDEFHHGFGMHGGSFTAISRYLARTPSGHFFAQAVLAGLLLLLALGPRPLPPTDAQIVARRSPLDHADALAQAYADVDATRTATQRLLSGLRRRAGRTVPASAGADDEVFLDAVVARDASLGPQVALIRRALREPVPARELAAVGDALRVMEQHLLLPPQRTL
jgi:hypothetical protein